MRKSEKHVSLPFPYHRGIKWLGIVIVLFSLAGLITRLIQGQLSDLSPVPQLVSLGLVFIFFSKEKVEDERIHHLKFRSLSLGFLYSYFLTFAFPYLVTRPISAHEFIALALIFTTGVYYYSKNH